MNLSDLIIVGGVARNTFMRIQLNELAVREGIEVHFPPLSLCTDNAAMIAALGYRQRDRALLSPMSINAYSTKALKSGRTTVEDLNI
jgi:N6-L-threonylcarbamoyladenine synthase